MLDEDDKDRETCYYEASFNIEKIKISEILYGLQLTMVTNKPFGYGQEQTVHWVVNDIERTYLLSDISDEIGYIIKLKIFSYNTEFYQHQGWRPLHPNAEEDL